MTGPTIAHIPGWPAGVVQEGSADTQRTDELRSCDGYDIGPRGAIIASRDTSDYVSLVDLQGSPAAWTGLHKLKSVSGGNFTSELAVGEGKDAGAVLRYLLAQFVRENTSAAAITSFGALSVRSEGVVVTVAEFPGAYAVTNAAETINVFLVNIGARENFAPNVAPGLYVAYVVPASTTILLAPISSFDALGTGSRSADKSGGTKASQLYFRGITAYNTFAIGWGFDTRGGSGKDGPSRLMFSNIANPLKWGNDDQGAATTDRFYTDSDAIFIGDGGEIIRGGLTWRKRFWIGTDKQMHYLAGFGRNSFLTDGSNPIAKAENIVGPNAMVEGPDGLLYGVGELGMWAFDEGSFERHHKRLRNFSGTSIGYWDLIWTNPLNADTYPGKTNADLVWMVADWELDQVVVGIPWCNATSGRGYGTDTVLIKFNVRTSGFSRQAFLGRTYTAGDYLRRQRQYREARFLGTATAAKVSVQKFGDALVTGSIATPLPKFGIGPHALYGPDGDGVYRKLFATLEWEASNGGLGSWTIRVSAADQAWKSVAVSPAGMHVAVSESGAATPASDDFALTLNGTPDAAGITLGAPSSAAFCDLASANGIETTFSVHYDVDTTLKSGGGLMRVKIYKNDGVASTSWTQVGISTYDDGSVWTDEIITFIAEMNQDFDVKLEVTYTGTPSVNGIVLADRVTYNVLAAGAVMSSPDGIVWTLRSAAGSKMWTSVCYAASLGLFVAVARGGTVAAGNRVMTSPDGTNWTARASAADKAWESVCWSPELSLLVAVANTTIDTNQVMTSPDGTAWTIRVSAATNGWRSVTWSPEKTLFVAVAETGTGNRVMTSPDGTAWTIRVSAADNNWQSVASAEELGLLVAVAASGSGNRIMTSFDGIAWVLVASPVDNNWYGLAYASIFSQFVAVASSGTGNRVMTANLLPVDIELAFDIIPYVDDKQLATVRLTVKKTAPSSPAEGDIWVDISGTDTSIGNATAGLLIPAAADYIVKNRYRNAWQYLFVTGQKGQRITVPIAFTPKAGRRLSVDMNTITANRRFQIEGLGLRLSRVHGP